MSAARPPATTNQPSRAPSAAPASTSGRTVAGSTAVKVSCASEAAGLPPAVLSAVKVSRIPLRTLTNLSKCDSTMVESVPVVASSPIFSTGLTRRQPCAARAVSICSMVRWRELVALDHERSSDHGDGSMWPGASGPTSPRMRVVAVRVVSSGRSAAVCQPSQEPNARAERGQDRARGRPSRRQTEPLPDAAGQQMPCLRAVRRHAPDRGDNVSAVTEYSIKRVGQADLDELLPLMRSYCDFYEVSPTDADLLALARALIDDPQREGVQLLARDGGGRAAGFATLYWSWSTTDASRIGVMNDLFVAERARGRGRGRTADRSMPGGVCPPGRAPADVADGARQPSRSGRLRSSRRYSGAMDGLLAGLLMPLQATHVRSSGQPDR